MPFPRGIGTGITTLEFNTTFISFMFDTRLRQFREICSFAADVPGSSPRWRRLSTKIRRNNLCTVETAER